MPQCKGSAPYVIVILRSSGPGKDSADRDSFDASLGCGCSGSYRCAHAGACNGAAERWSCACQRRGGHDKFGLWKPNLQLGAGRPWHASPVFANWDTGAVGTSLQCRAVAEMMMERCMLEEAESTERLLAGSKNLLLKHATGCSFSACFFNPILG